jgi:hypothetical protein
MYWSRRALRWYSVQIPAGMLVMLVEVFMFLFQIHSSSVIVFNLNTQIESYFQFIGINSPNYKQNYICIYYVYSPLSAFHSNVYHQQITPDWLYVSQSKLSLVSIPHVKLFQMFSNSCMQYVTSSV